MTFYEFTSFKLSVTLTNQEIRIFWIRNKERHTFGSFDPYAGSDYFLFSSSESSLTRFDIAFDFSS